MHDPVQLRREIRAQRRALSPQTQQTHSQAMGGILTATTLFRNSSRIAVYVEHDGEMGVTHLISRILSHGKRCYLPVLRPMLPNRLWFSEYRPGDRLIQNRYGIIEPDIRRRRPVAAWALDLVLVPLVAFDATGNRIGMGAGFYDRTFAYLTSRNRWRKPKLIGIAHKLQQLDLIQSNHWDIPLDGVVTEAHWHRPPPSNSGTQ